MTDFREIPLSIKKVSGSEAHIMKGDLKLCKVLNDGNFKEILAGDFDKKTGFTGDTLIEIGIFLNRINKS